MQNMNRFLSYLPGFAAALTGALLANLLNLPIPWLLGSLLACATLSICGANIRTLPSGRKVGLCIIGMSLGLYFTPQMVGMIGTNALWLGTGMLFALILSLCGTLLLYRFAGIDFKTAWFAAAVGGASEMANLAEQHGARVDKVVAAHSLRVLIVVTIVPFFYRFMDYHGLDNSIIDKGGVHYGGLLLLIACCAGTGWLFQKRGWANPWTFGPLAAAVLLTVCGVHLSAIPKELSWAGQLLIGWSLGTKFRSDFFRAAPRLLSVTAVLVCMSLLLTAGVSQLLATWSDIPLPTLGLGLAPGGVAEMTITAKVLQLGVPLVTAFHVLRMLVVVGLAGWLYGVLDRRFGIGAR